jgi:hypothetical protein
MGAAGFEPATSRVTTTRRRMVEAVADYPNSAPLVIVDPTP